MLGERIFAAYLAWANCRDGETFRGKQNNEASIGFSVFSQDSSGKSRFQSGVDWKVLMHRS
jgi:hypothetical protein